MDVFQGLGHVLRLHQLHNGGGEGWCYPQQYAVETVGAEKGEVPSYGLPTNKEKPYLVRSGRSSESMTVTAIVRLDHSFRERCKKVSRPPQLPSSLDTPLF